MENDYDSENQQRENYLKSINLHIPEWARKIVEIYLSHRNNELKNKMNAEK
jgi:hypothetical protein